MIPVISDEIRYRILSYLNEHPEASQRDVAKALGVSVGKVNYCLRALIEKGLLKMRNFRNSKNKRAYTYILTPKGIEEKVNVTLRFLRRKIEEYNALSTEIERLNRELVATEDSEADSRPVSAS
jgi:EPS-associated MarR family transcriptional regulator